MRRFFKKYFLFLTCLSVGATHLHSPPKKTDAKTNESEQRLLMAATHAYEAERAEEAAARAERAQALKNAMAALHSSGGSTICETPTAQQQAPAATCAPAPQAPPKPLQQPRVIPTPYAMPTRHPPIASNTNFPPLPPPKQSAVKSASSAAAAPQAKPKPEQQPEKIAAAPTPYAIPTEPPPAPTCALPLPGPKTPPASWTSKIDLKNTQDFRPGTTSEESGESYRPEVPAFSQRARDEKVAPTTYFLMGFNAGKECARTQARAPQAAAVCTSSAAVCAPEPAPQASDLYVIPPDCDVEALHEKHRSVNQKSNESLKIINRLIASQAPIPEDHLAALVKELPESEQANSANWDLAQLRKYWSNLSYHSNKWLRAISSHRKS